MTSKHSYVTYLRILVLGISTIAGAAHATDFSMGLNYSNGGMYSPIYSGVPVVGYGAAGYGMGAVNGACQQMNAYMPPPLPPIPGPVATGWGGANASFPGPWAVPQTCGIPCGAGMIPQPIMAVPGGPYLGANAGYGLSANMSFNNGVAGISAAGAGGYDAGYSASSGYGSGVIQIGEQNEWEKSDTASIIAATAMGMGMQATTVMPVAYPRTYPTQLGPQLYNMGDRDYGFVARPTTHP